MPQAGRSAGGAGRSTGSPPRGQGQEVAENLRALDRQETLRVELDAVQRPLLVADAHDFALVRPGAHLEVRMVPRLLLDDQAVIPGGRERVREAGEDPP